MTAGIYWVYQPSQDRAVYVGSSGNIANRWRQHRSVLKHGTAHNRYFQRVWNKYGPADFEFRVLEECTIERLIEREQFWADALEPICNMAEFVDNPTRGRPMTEEHRAKLSEAAKRRPSRKGKYSAEVLARMSTAQKGHAVSEEQRHNISAALTGRKQSETTKAKRRAPMLGNQYAKNPSAEVRQRISEAQKKRAPATAETRRKLSEAVRLVWARRRAQEKE